uniref:Uncharacterized protein n=1 Tax=Gopherus evgoodei TaxID=1825980 RepID=A0A8C4YAA3_9SAUR
RGMNVMGTNQTRTGKLGSMPAGEAWSHSTLYDLWFLSHCQDQAIALTAMFAAFLIPSGWILAHMEDYKRKPSE